MKPETYQQQMKRLQKRTLRRNMIRNTGGGGGLQDRNQMDNSWLKYWLQPKPAK